MTTHWMTQAVCRGMDVRIFFPPPGTNPVEALAACAQCPVRIECHQFAEDTQSAGGVWGGRRRSENGRTRVYPNATRQDALAIWATHRPAYASDGNCAQAIAKHLAVEDSRTILAWARVAGLATTPTPSAKPRDIRDAAITAYRQQRPNYQYDLHALEAVATQYGISTTSLRTWTREAEKTEKPAAAP